MKSFSYMIFIMLKTSIKSWGMIGIVSHWNIVPGLLCGRTNRVIKKKIKIFKIRPVSSAQRQFLMGFLDSHPKKYKPANFHEVWPYRTQVMATLLNTKIQNSRFPKKMAPKLPKFQNPIYQEPFKVTWKIFPHFCFLLIGMFEQNLFNISEYEWHGCPSLRRNHLLTLLFSYLKN